MSVDPEVLAAPKKALAALNDDTQGPVPADVLEALAPLAKDGTALKIDMAASVAIGAPLVTLGKAEDPSDLFEGLTRRQREVAELVIAGKSNKDIAESLSISIATVKDHVHAILQQLELPSRSAVVAAVKR